MGSLCRRLLARLLLSKAKVSKRGTAVKHSKGSVCQPVFTWHLDWQQSDWKYPPFTGASPWVQGKCFCSLAVMAQVWIEGWRKMLHSGHSQGGADTVEMMQEQSEAPSRSPLNVSELLSQCTLSNLLAFIGATPPLWVRSCTHFLSSPFKIPHVEE